MYERFKALSLILVSCGVAFLIVEFSYRFIKGLGVKNEFTVRTMLFDSGNNFQNHEGYFKYFPNTSIRSLTLYSKTEPKDIADIVIEYDYVISTNNVGLVMTNDLETNDKVAFVIGDSFTEGQGALPWFYDLESGYDTPDFIKLVNLGILGTGPMQWKNLASSITKELGLRVKGSVVNIIPADMPRSVWNFKVRELECLSKAKCDYLYGFQGYKFIDSEGNEDIKRNILKSINQSIHIGSFFQLIRYFAKRSHVVTVIYDEFVSLNDNDDVVTQNEVALLALKAAVNDKFFVNVVSEKSVNSTNYEDYRYAKGLIEFLEVNSIDYGWCDIPLDGFHKNDSHPNAKGYTVLRKCTENALSNVFD